MRAATLATWRTARELGGRLAASGALAIALVSLLRHAPVWLACLHGAATLVVLALAARLGAAALGRASECDRELAARQREARS